MFDVLFGQKYNYTLRYWCPLRQRFLEQDFYCTESEAISFADSVWQLRRIPLVLINDDLGNEVLKR